MCKAPNCKKKVFARGYCGKHYVQIRHHGRLTPELENHGMYGTKIYKTWSSMMRRCYTKSQTAYSSYGGRGITVCDSWHNFRNFYEDMGDVPEGYTLERIDNDGNYEPSNCKWATQAEQTRNRRIFKNNSSGYTGVHFVKSTKKWQARFLVHGKRISLGHFPDLEDAIKARKEAELKYW